MYVQLMLLKPVFSYLKLILIPVKTGRRLPAYSLTRRTAASKSLLAEYMLLTVLFCWSLTTTLLQYNVDCNELWSDTVSSVCHHAAWFIMWLNFETECFSVLRLVWGEERGLQNLPHLLPSPDILHCVQKKNTHSHFLSYLHELFVDLNKNRSEYTQGVIDSDNVKIRYSLRSMT